MADGYADGLIVPPPTLLAGDDWRAALAAPPPTLVAGSNNAVLAIPPVTLVSNDGNTARLSIPPVTLVSELGYIAILSIPPVTLAGDFGNRADLLIVPPPTLIASFGLESELSAPPPTLVATIVGGALITLDEILPPPTLSASGTGATLIAVQAVAPSPILIASGISGTVSTALLVVPPPRLAAVGLSGSVSTVAITIATPTLLATGYAAYNLTFANTVPAPALGAFLSSPIAANYDTWVLNTRKGALTSYGPEFAFNSYAMFNGVVLGCTAAGVVVLGTQADDNGAAIDAVARTGKSDYDRSLLKRVPRLYIDYSTDGDMIFRTITSESGTRSYPLPTNNVIGFQQRRVPIGKGPKAAYWQYEFENVNGADFTTRGIMAYPVMLRRRIM